jgi:hypothetical protein
MQYELTRSVAISSDCLKEKNSQWVWPFALEQRPHD